MAISAEALVNTANLSIQLPVRWVLALPYPGAGNIADLERDCATFLHIRPADRDLGLLLYATARDGVLVALEIMRRRPDLNVYVVSDDGQVVDPRV